MKKIIITLGMVGLVGIIVLVLVPNVYLSELRQFNPVTIPAGEYSLNGYLSTGSNPQGPFVIFFHGNRREGEDHPLYQQILKMFPAEMTVLGIDALGYGGSSVDQSVDPVRMLNHEQDLLGAVAFLEKNLGAKEDQIILVGHSMGATIVMKGAINDSYRLSIPIGLGDWDAVLDNPQRVREHIRKLKENTGVAIDPEMLLKYNAQYVPEVTFGSCPRTPVRLIFAMYDDGRQPLYPFYSKAQKECPSLVHWRIIPFSDHTYWTEQTVLPASFRQIFSRAALSLLKWQILGLIRDASS